MQHIVASATQAEAFDAHQDALNLGEFRLPESLFQRLSGQAEAEGLSVGETARRLLVAVLQDEDRLRVLEEVSETRLDVSKLRADVATTLETVLLNVTKTPPETVRKWVSEKLRR